MKPNLLTATTLLAALAILPATASEAQAHPAPYPHRHVYRPAPRVRYHAPVVRVRRPPVVIVEEPAPVTVVRRPPPTEQPARPEPQQLLGVGLRLSSASIEGSKAGLSADENPTMGGIGLQVRSRFDRHLGLELSIDSLGGSGEDFEQSTVPVMAALTYHLFPESRLQPYVLGGLGVHFTRLSYLEGKYAIDSADLAGQLGGGLELFLSRSLSLHADLRGQTIFNNLDSQERVREDCLAQVGNLQGFCDGIQRADAEDKMNLGLQLQAGATLYF